MDCKYLTIALLLWPQRVGDTVAKIISAVCAVPLELVVDGAVLGVEVEWLQSVIVVAIVVAFVALKDERSE